MRCHIEDLCINHVFYADKLCLMAHCAIALHELINLCYEHSLGIVINFSALKSYCHITASVPSMNPFES